MSSKNFFASAAVASVLAFTTPAGAQVLGGGLSGAVGGTLSGGLSGVGGFDGVGGLTSTATSTVRDVNSIGRVTTQHAHDTVSATADVADRAAANVDTQLESAKGATHAAANVTGDAASSVDTNAAKPGKSSDEGLLAKGALDGALKGSISESNASGPAPSETPKAGAVKASNVDASVGGSASGYGNASMKR